MLVSLDKCRARPRVQETSEYTISLMFKVDGAYKSLCYK